MSDAQAPAAFVMPHYADRPDSYQYLPRAISSLVAQSDPDWRLVIVDDGSPGDARERLEDLATLHQDRISVIYRDVNEGAGSARNVGVRWAVDNGAPFILFLDADDMAHPERLLRVRRVFDAHPRVDFVYSSFIPVDADDAPIDPDSLAPSIREIIDSHSISPVAGSDAFAQIASVTGYTTLTSTVAVRAELAREHPFPASRVSEDAHAWMRMVAAARDVFFLEDTPSLYRLPPTERGSSMRDRIGPTYYEKKAEVDTHGFLEGLAIALREGKVSEAAVPQLKLRFLLRLAETMEAEGCEALAALILQSADEPDAMLSQLSRAAADEIKLATTV